MIIKTVCMDQLTRCFTSCLLLGGPFFSTKFTTVVDPGGWRIEEDVINMFINIRNIQHKSQIIFQMNSFNFTDNICRNSHVILFYSIQLVLLFHIKHIQYDTINECYFVNAVLGLPLIHEYLIRTFVISPSGLLFSWTRLFIVLTSD